MKKFLLSIIALATVATASAQGFNWGVKAGVNFSTFSGTTTNSKADIKTDFVGGAFAEYKFNKLIGLNVELLYAGQGTKWDIGNELTAYQHKGATHTSNLNIPIMANFHITKFLSLGTGIQPGFLLGAKNTIDGLNQEEVDVLYLGDAKSNMNKFSLAVPINVRFQLDFGLMFDIRYNIALTEVYKSDYSVWSTERGARYNDNISITVGWKF